MSRPQIHAQQGGNELELIDGAGETAARFSGPIPPPSLLAKYGEINSTLVDRIVTMAENQAAHRQALEKALVDGRVFATKSGIYAGCFIAFAVLLTAAYIAHLGHPWASALLAGIDLAGLVGIFVTGRTKTVAPSKLATETPLPQQRPDERALARTGTRR